jgi:hypothetical protein
VVIGPFRDARWYSNVSVLPSKELPKETRRARIRDLHWQPVEYFTHGEPCALPGGEGHEFTNRPNGAGLIDPNEWKPGRLNAEPRLNEAVLCGAALSDSQNVSRFLLEPTRQGGRRDSQELSQPPGGLHAEHKAL